MSDTLQPLLGGLSPQPMNKLHTRQRIKWKCGGDAEALDKVAPAVRSKIYCKLGEHELSDTPEGD